MSNCLLDVFFLATHTRGVLRSNSEFDDRCAFKQLSKIQKKFNDYQKIKFSLF